VAEGGGLLGSDFRICGPKALLNDYDPAAAWNGVLNQYLVVWTDARSYFDGRSFDIYSRLVGG
jgi:hypothetical protein